MVEIGATILNCQPLCVPMFDKSLDSLIVQELVPFF